jgi:hypothetical protein
MVALNENWQEFQKIAELEKEMSEGLHLDSGGAGSLLLRANAWACRGEPGSLGWEETDARVKEYCSMSESQRKEIEAKIDEFHRPDFVDFMRDQTKAFQEWWQEVCPYHSEKEAYNRWMTERAPDYREEWKKANPGKDISEGIEKLDALYPDLNKNQMAQAYIDVCRAAEKLRKSLKKVFEIMRAVNESESDVNGFKERIEEVISDYKQFKSFLGKYFNIVNNKLVPKEISQPDSDDIITETIALHSAVTAANLVYREHKLHPNRYKDSKVVQALLATIIGTGQTNRNAATGQIEQSSIGLIREFAELSFKFIKTMDKSPMNESEDFNKAKEYIEFVLTSHSWSKNQ